MSTLVADASALISLGIVTADEPDPLVRCLACYELVVPAPVIEELREIPSYDDVVAPAELQLSLSDGLGDGDTTRLDIQWSELGICPF